MINDTVKKLKAIMGEKYLTCPQDGKLALIEEKNKHKKGHVHSISILTGMAETTFAVKFDETGFPGKLLKEDHYIHKRCDYFIFHVMTDGFYVFCVEMKPDDSGEDYKKQLASAECFLDYLESICRHKLNEQEMKIIRRYILITNKALMKRSSISKDKNNNCVGKHYEKPLVIPVLDRNSLKIEQFL